MGTYRMEPSVQRTRHEVGRRGGDTTLVQTFRFGGGVTSAAIAGVLRGAPLVGPDSIFGERPGSEEHVDATSGSTSGSSRRLSGFSPVPGFRFDVELSEPEPGVFMASFSQDDRRTPYLAGDAVWFVNDGPDGRGDAVFEEEINTERAAGVGARPLTGPKPSLRRWLFFRLGHAKVMSGATSQMARLAG